MDIIGFSKPDFEIPAPITFHSIGKMKNYPLERWSNAVRKAVAELVDEKAFIYTMDDFWLIRQANQSQIERLFEYACDHPAVSRIDLTTDRLYAENLINYGYLDEIDLITNARPSNYALSLQAGIWRKDAFLKYVHDNETPHETELMGTNRVNSDLSSVVLGTRQAPLKYLIAIQFGKLALDGGYQVPSPKFEDLADLEDKGLLNGLYEVFSP